MGANVGTQPHDARSVSWEEATEVVKTSLMPLPAIEEEVQIKAKEGDLSRQDDPAVRTIPKKPVDLQDQQDLKTSTLEPACRNIGEAEDVEKRIQAAAQNIKKMEEAIAEMKAVPTLEFSNAHLDRAMHVEALKSEVDARLEALPAEANSIDFQASEEGAAAVDTVTVRVQTTQEASLPILTPPLPSSMPSSEAPSPTDLSPSMSHSLPTQASAKIAVQLPTRTTSGQRLGKARTPIRRTSELVASQGNGTVRAQPTSMQTTRPHSTTVNSQTAIGMNGILRASQARQMLLPKQAVPAARTPPAPTGVRGHSSLQLCVRMPSARSVRAPSPAVPRQLSPDRVAVPPRQVSRSPFTMLTPRVCSSPGRAPPQTMVRTLQSRSGSMQSTSPQYTRVVKQSTEQDPAGFGEAAAAIERASELLEKVSQRNSGSTPTVGGCQPTLVSQAVPADTAVRRTASAQRALPSSVSASCPAPVHGTASLSNSLRLVSPPRINPPKPGLTIGGGMSPRAFSPPQRAGAATLSASLLASSLSPRLPQNAGSFQAPLFKGSVKRSATIGSATPVAATTQVLTVSGRGAPYMRAGPSSRSPSPTVVRGVSVPAMHWHGAMLQQGNLTDRSTSPAPRCMARLGNETPRGVFEV